MCFLFNQTTIITIIMHGYCHYDYFYHHYLLSVARTAREASIKYILGFSFLLFQVYDFLCLVVCMNTYYCYFMLFMSWESLTEQLPNHLHRNLKAFEVHICPVCLRSCSNTLHNYLFAHKIRLLIRASG